MELNPNMKLNADLNNSEKKSTRDGFGDGIFELGQENQNIVALCGDLTESLRLNKFKERFPDRFFDIGIAEQNMAGISAGLASCGKIPYICSFGEFVAGRAWEQIKLDIAYSGFNVKIIGSHQGVTLGEDGATQAATEDIATMRVLPNVNVIVPCDYIETKKATKAISQIKNPCYLRFGRPKQAVITTQETPFEIGKANVLKWGDDVSIIACGTLVHEALKAAENLEKQGINARVINCHTIKPLDKDTLLKAANETKAIVTAEEHQINGGLGGAVAELISEECPVPIIRIGINDKYTESGTADELMKAFNLTSEDIVNAVKKAIEKKS